MKNFPPALAAFIAANPNCARADLFNITLANGQQLNVTSSQIDLVAPTPNVLSNPYLESLANLVVYDNNNTGHVSIALASGSSPNPYGSLLQIKTVAGGGTSPGLGGFYYATALGTGPDTYAQNSSYLVTIVANVPLGYTLGFGNNTLGGGIAQFTSSTAGTGTWATYTILVTTGTTAAGLFTTNAFPFFYLSGPAGAPVTWYAATVTIQPVVTYSSSKYGAWQRGKVTSEATFDLHSNDMSLTALVASAILFPGTSTSLMQTVLAGLFDKSLVTVLTAYWALNGSPAAGIANGLETKFVGQITGLEQLGRSKVEFRVSDMLFMLNLKSPPNVIQASCRHTLYDSNCTLNKASFAFSNSVGVGSTTQSIALGTTVGNAPPYYSQGFITFTSGQNAGLTYAIKQQISTANILLAAQVSLPLTVGDTFTMYAGCDKTPATCAARFNNLINIGAQPFVPNPEVAV